jgi:hypothetical protein
MKIIAGTFALFMLGASLGRSGGNIYDNIQHHLRKRQKAAITMPATGREIKERAERVNITLIGYDDNKTYEFPVDVAKMENLLQPSSSPGAKIGMLTGGIGLPIIVYALRKRIAAKLYKL